MMDLHDLLATVLARYSTEKQKPNSFTKNPIAALLRKGLSDSVSSDLLAGNLKSNGSAGVSQWATVPWIMVNDSEMSSGAQKGYYLVYLFNPRMDGVYLSLHQGWTHFHELYGNRSVENLHRVSNYWENQLTTLTPRMTFDPIKLDGSGKNSLGQAYERCNIASIYYPKTDLPSNAQLVSDLKDMLVCYAELKSKLLDPNDYENSTRFILDQPINQQLTPTTKRQLMQKAKHVTLMESEVNEPKKSYHARKVDYDQLHQQNADIGFLGELLVLAHEKQKLAGRPDLQARVEQVSQTQGDGLGYDIASFDPQGRPMYIEVKTTTGDEQTPFHISRNELKFSEDHADQYCLYRLYNFDQLATSNQISFFKTYGDLSNHFKFIPESFVAKRLS